jgi:hypothetical protein
MKKGEIERAIADYGLAIATDALSAAAYYNRGEIINAPKR